MGKRKRTRKSQKEEESLRSDFDNDNAFATYKRVIDEFKKTLALIKENDTVYQVRNKLVNNLVDLARLLGFERGFRISEEDDAEEWPIVCITLPKDFGQVSWHVPKSDFSMFGKDELLPYPQKWDRHTTEVKYERIDNFIKHFEADFK